MRSAGSGVLAAAALLLAAAPLPARAQRYVTGHDPLHSRIRYADSLVSANDRCLVELKTLDPRIPPVYVNGVPMGFCCTPCPGTFGKGPEPYLKNLRIRVRDVLDGRRAAVLEPGMRIIIGHDIFFFAGVASRDRFAKDPLRYVRRLTDPVTRMRFRPSRRSPRAEFEGRAYYFSSDSTRARFLESPGRFPIGHGVPLP